MSTTFIKLNAEERKTIINDLSTMIKFYYDIMADSDLDTTIVVGDQKYVYNNVLLGKIHKITMLISSICNIGCICDTFDVEDEEISAFFVGFNEGITVVKNYLYNKFGIRIDD